MLFGNKFDSIGKPVYFLLNGDTCKENGFVREFVSCAQEKLAKHKFLYF